MTYLERAIAEDPNIPAPILILTRCPSDFGLCRTCQPELCLCADCTACWLREAREQDLKMDPDGCLHNGKEELPCLKKNWLKN